MKVSIAVQSYKNPEMLSVCLKSVQEHCAGLDYELIVADGETEDETKMMMREDFSDVVFLPHKDNVGFGAMVNACIDKASGEYIFFINFDTVLESDTVTKFIEFMDAHPKVGLAGPKQKNFNGKYENTRFRFYKPQTILYRRTFLKGFSFAKKHLEHFEMKDVKKDEPYSVDWVIGSAM
ncbi:MAG: glycosyltransferase, partial [Patescibacteria group bacterium]